MQLQRSINALDVSANVRDYAVLFGILVSIHSATVVLSLAYKENSLFTPPWSSLLNTILLSTPSQGDGWLMYVECIWSAVACLGKYLFASLACTAPAEAILCTVLVLRSGQVERVCGSARLFHLVVFLFFIHFPTWLAGKLLVSQFSGMPLQINVMRPSPAWLCIALHCFHRMICVPRYPFKLIGIPMSEFFVGDFLVVQLSLLYAPDTLFLNGVSGILCGLVLASSFLHPQRHRLLPHALTSRLFSQRPTYRERYF